MHRLYMTIGLAFLLALAAALSSAQGMGDLKNLARKQTEVKSKRISSFDRSGGNNDRIEDFPTGAVRELFNVKGAGVITHIWMTTNGYAPGYRRDVILRMYWDGEKEPSVEAPLGDFFGNGWGEFYNFSSLPLACAPRQGRSMVCYFPMPFARSARITVENDSPGAFESFYYQIDYDEYPALPEGLSRFHAWWNHQITRPAPLEIKVNTTGEYNYVLADITGAGQYVGTNYYINNPLFGWYGEGDDMFFIDGESWPPALHGTGTEDYFNQAFGMPERFDHPYFGLARLNRGLDQQGRVHAYRFHIQDPIHFTKSLRATIEHGHNNNYIMEMSTVAYWYQDEPHKPFPPLPSHEARKPVSEAEFLGVPKWYNEGK